MARKIWVQLTDPYKIYYQEVDGENGQGVSESVTGKTNPDGTQSPQPCLVTHTPKLVRALAELSPIDRKPWIVEVDGPAAEAAPAPAAKPAAKAEAAPAAAAKG